MNVNEVVDYVSKFFKSFDWFYEAGLDEYNRPTVYANRIDKEVLAAVSRLEEQGGFRLGLHFASYKKTTRETFVHDATRRPFAQPPVVSVEEPEVEMDMAGLQRELDRLEKSCGSNILQDIFYEIHDGSNAVTNLSARFPDVREGMQKLYRIYGFDVIFNELDG